MDPASPENSQPTALPKRGRSRRRLVRLAIGVLLVYLGVAYIVLPRAWRGYAKHHPSLEDIPGITYTAAEIPGDPLNVALIGTEMEVKTDPPGGEMVPGRSAHAAQLHRNGGRSGLEPHLR